MTQRKSYRAYVLEDLDRIDVRAMTLYALSDPAVPWPLAGDIVRHPFREKAGTELWGEGALHLDPSIPYHESE